MIPTIWTSYKPRRNYPMLSLFDEMNRFFDDAGTSSAARVSNFDPKIDVKETPTEFVLSAEFPGMDKDEIILELKDNSLTLSGEKRFEQEKKEGERTYIERSYGSFLRSFPFETEIDEDNATAEMKNGVLTIKVPKSAKVIKGAKKLSIKASN